MTSSSQDLTIFQNFLEEDLTWRKTEISKLFMLSSLGSDDTLKCKAIILFLYSHWEGYMKNIAKRYLLYVSNQKIKCDELSEVFSAILLKGSFSLAFESKDSLTLTNQLKFVKEFDDIRNSFFKVPDSILDEKDKQFINSHNNLTIKNLNRILTAIDVPVLSLPEEGKDYLGKNLINQRNGIGHGNKVNLVTNRNQLTISDISNLRDFTFMLMEHFSEILSVYAKREFFKIANSVNKEIFDSTSKDKLDTQIDKFFNPEKYRKQTRAD
ncbi:hypothetical protein ACER1C_003136 [Vibrio alginolyticus]